MRPGQIHVDDAATRTITKVLIRNGTQLAVLLDDATYFVVEAITISDDQQPYLEAKTCGSADVEFDLGIISRNERDRLRAEEAQQRRDNEEREERCELKRLIAKYGSAC